MLFTGIQLLLQIIDVLCFIVKLAPGAFQLLLNIAQLLA